MLAAKSDHKNEELLHMLGAYGSETLRLDDYENLYRDFLKAKPDSLAIKKKLTELFIVKGELQKAWAFTHEIAKAQPGDTDATYFYGRLHLAQKEWARAAEGLFYATRDAPSFAFAHYFLRLARPRPQKIPKGQHAFPWGPKRISP